MLWILQIYILCMLISKLPGGIMERWNRKVLSIKRHQVREPILVNMTDATEDEIILMDHPLKCLLMTLSS